MEKQRIELNEQLTTVSQLLFNNNLVRSYQDQRYQSNGLNVVVASIILWNTVYLSQAVKALEIKGIEITEEYLVHLSHLGWEHINLAGDYVWNLRKEQI